MHDIALPIAFVGLLVFLAHLFTALFRRTKTPDVLLLIIIGLAVGPLLGLVRPGEFGIVGKYFTTLTLVMILFEGGLELDLRVIAATWKQSLTLTLGSFFLSVVLVSVGGVYLLQMPVTQSILMGFILAPTAPAVIVPMVRQLKMTRESQTVLFIESAVSEVFAIVIVIAFIEFLKVGGGLKIGGLVGTVLSSFLASTLLGIGTGFFWSIVLSKMRRLKNSIFTTPAFVFVVFGLVEWLGWSGPIAALAFGITLGNIEIFKIPMIRKIVPHQPIRLNRMEKVFFSEIVFLMKTFFFVYIGVLFELDGFLALSNGLLLTIGIYFVRVIAVRFGIPKETPSNEAALMCVLPCKGLATAVMGALPFQSMIEGGTEIQQITYGVILTSIVLTSVLIFMVEKTFVGRVYSFPFHSFGKKAVEEKAKAGG